MPGRRRLTLAHLALAYSRMETPLEHQIIKSAAFLGRYGHQSFDVVIKMPITQFKRLVAEVGNLIREENDAVRSRMETDG